MTSNAAMRSGGFWPAIQAARGGITAPSLTEAYGPGAALSITCEVSVYGELDGAPRSQDPHFGVTAEVVTTESRRHRDIAAGGCLHDEALRYWPKCAPLVALHLSSAVTGEPMHGEDNGFYWLEGLWGPKGLEGGDHRFGGPYHGGNAPLQWIDETGAHRYGPAPLRYVLDIFASQVRMRPDEALELSERITAAAEADLSPCPQCDDGLSANGQACQHCGATGRLAWRRRVRKAWAAEYAAMLPRFKRERDEGIAWLWANASPPDLLHEWRNRVREVLGVELDWNAGPLHARGKEVAS